MMLQIIKEKRLSKLRKERNKVEETLIQYIGVDNSKYWSTYKTFQTIQEQIIKLAAK